MADRRAAEIAVGSADVAKRVETDGASEERQSDVGNELCQGIQVSEELSQTKNNTVLG